MSEAIKRTGKRGENERTHQHADDLEPWAIARIAKVFGVDRMALIKRIGEAKLEPTKKTNFATYYYPRDIVAMLMASREGAKADAELKGAEARYKEARAKQAELKLKAFERELVPADEVIRALSDLLVNVRRKLLAVPSKVAPRMVKAKTPELAMALLKTEVSLALEDLSNTEPNALLSGGATKGDEDAE